LRQGLREGLRGVYQGLRQVLNPTQHQQPATPGEEWIKNWTQLLIYMRQYIPNEPRSHGCMGTNLAARVQEIIAAHPSTTTGHQNMEKEINALLKDALTTMKQQ
jgi:hypothetical protein